MEHNECELEVTPELEKQLIDLFNIEIEVMKGSRIKLSNGLIKIRFKVSDEKGKIIMRFIHMVMFSNKEINSN